MRRSMTTVAGGAEGFPCDSNRVGVSLAGDGQRAPEVSHIMPAVPDMDKPPGRYDVTVRVEATTATPCLTRRPSRSRPGGQHRA